MAEAERGRLGDLEAEQAVLGMGILEPSLWPSILARLSREDFTSPQLGALVGYAAERAAAGTLVGLAELGSRVDHQDRQQLIELRTAAPPASRLPYWCDRVRESGARARLARLGGWLRAASGDPERPAAELAAEAVRGISEIMAPGIAAKVLAPQQWLSVWWADMERRAESGEPMALPTGIPTLDQDVMVEPGHMVLVAAPTGGGKTAFGLSAARSAAKSGRSVLYANTEMDPASLAMRILAAETGVAVRDMRRGELTQECWNRVAGAMSRISEAWPLYLTEPLAGTGPEVIGHLARAHRSEHGLDALFVDYVGRLDIQPRPGEREWNVLERTAAGLKSLAVELGCVVYLLVQRTDEGTIAGSRRMRNDADLVLEITAIDDDDRKSRERWPGATHVVDVTKSRHSRGGFSIPLAFMADRMTWAEVGRP